MTTALTVFEGAMQSAVEALDERTADTRDSTMCLLCGGVLGTKTYSICRHPINLTSRDHKGHTVCETCGSESLNYVLAGGFCKLCMQELTPHQQRTNWKLAGIAIQPAVVNEVCNTINIKNEKLCGEIHTCLNEYHHALKNAEERAQNERIQEGNDRRNEAVEEVRKKRAEADEAAREAHELRERAAREAEEARAAREEAAQQAEALREQAARDADEATQQARQLREQAAQDAEEARVAQMAQEAAAQAARDAEALALRERAEEARVAQEIAARETKALREQAAQEAQELRERAERDAEDTERRAAVERMKADLQHRERLDEEKRERARQRAEEDAVNPRERIPPPKPRKPRSLASREASAVKRAEKKRKIETTEEERNQYKEESERFFARTTIVIELAMEFLAAGRSPEDFQEELNRRIEEAEGEQGLVDDDDDGD